MVAVRSSEMSVDCTKHYSVTSQKILFFTITAMRISNLAVVQIILENMAVPPE
jgi:hypothetical protein